MKITVTVIRVSCPELRGVQGYPAPCVVQGVRIPPSPLPSPIKGEGEIVLLSKERKRKIGRKQISGFKRCLQLQKASDMILLR
jgi:hypothetical protein